MTERVFNPFTGELDSVGINTENATPNNGDIAQFNSTTGLWEFVANSASNNIILEEIPSGSINDINKVFTLINSTNNQNIIVFLNGVRLQRVSVASRRDEFQHTSGSSSFTLGSPASTEGDGDFIVVTYKKV